MSKMEFLGALEAEKLKKQKWEQFWWTPCTSDISTNPISSLVSMMVSNTIQLLGHVLDIPD